MSDPRPPLHRPPLHQPPNPDDLRRAPPASRECASVRGLLRDFADGDLERGEHRQVEEHVHACFACSVELSRAEHEVVRLRRGFARVAAARALGEHGLPSDFAQRIVDSLVEGVAGDAAAGDGSWRTSTGRADDESGSPRAASPSPKVSGGTRGRPSVRRSNVLLACAALLLVCFGALAMWSIGAERGPEQSARLVVMSAKGAYGDAGRRLTIGDGLGEAQWLQVGAGGSAKFDWHDLSSGSQPAARLEMNGEGRMRLQKGAPLLLDGAVGIRTNRAVDIPVADGSHIHLGIGDYVIVAEAPMLNDDYLAQLRDPMSSAPADLRIRVEVLRGEAQIVRTDVGPTLIAAGSVGVYGGNSDVSVHPGGTQVAAVDGVPRGAPVGGASVPMAPTLSASVYQRGGLPSVYTQVSAVFAANGVPNFRIGATNAYGSVVLDTGDPCESDFAILRAVPAQLEYGVVAPDAFPLLRDGVQVRTEQALVLDVSQPLQGTIVDDFGQPRLGVRVVACIVDELFGDLFPINAEFDLTSSDEQGRFQLRRLPVTLPSYQHLVLVLTHPELQPTVVPVPARGGANALLPMPPIVIPSLSTVSLHWLTPNSQVVIWEEIPGLPDGRAVWRREFHANEQGKVPVARVGSGQMWWVIGPPGDHLVVKMTEDGTEALPRFRPLPVAGTPQGVFFRAMHNLSGTDLFLAMSYRHHRFDLPPQPSPANPFTMVARDTLNRTVALAQVFCLLPTGPRGTVDARFLGLTSAHGVISLEPVRYEGDLVVIAPDRSIAFVTHPQQAAPRLDAALKPAGRVLLGPALRPDPAIGPAVVTLRFQRQFEDMPGLAVTSVRFASDANGWEFAGLAPGFYFVQVNGMNRQVVVPEDGFVILQ